MGGLQQGLRATRGLRRRRHPVVPVSLLALSTACGPLALCVRAHGICRFHRNGRILENARISCVCIHVRAPHLPRAEVSRTTSPHRHVHRRLRLSRAASRPPAGGACLRATRVRRPVRPREPAVGRALAVVVGRGVDPALARSRESRWCGVRAAGGSVIYAERDRPRCSPCGGARDDRGRCKALPEASAPVGRESASRSAAESPGHGRPMHGQASPRGRAVRAGAALAGHALGSQSGAPAPACCSSASIGRSTSLLRAGRIAGASHLIV